MIAAKERRILRELAGRLADIAELPVMEQRREMWRRHNRLEHVRPLIFVSPEGSWDEIVPESQLQTRNESARKMERELRRRIAQHEIINDDTPIEKTWKVQKSIEALGNSIGWDINWGVKIKKHISSLQGGSYGFDPVINSSSDLKKIKPPEVIYDEAATMKELEEARDILGDILDVRLKGICSVAFHLMYYYIHFRGYEQMMYDLYDEPGMVHEAMARFEEGYNYIIKQCVEQNLFSLNNDDTYHSSGGKGYSTELPKPGFNPERVRLCDIWASAESQEMAQMSPEHHEVFVMRYEKRLLTPFGLNGYGCCDPLTDKLDYVVSMPNMRRISISPWADPDKCAARLKDKYIFSWKPNPVYISGLEFNPEKIRAYMKQALDSTKGCVVELISNSTQTCRNQPERFTEWVKIAKELAEQY